MPTRKLIEVALPLEAINTASARENYIYKGNPSAIHKWWAQRPLAACRAVLFASLVDDPSSHLDRFPTEEAQQRERERLFGIIERLVKWENSNNEHVLREAREEILKHTNGNPPPVYDPFAGGGSIPLEAQRLGLAAHASDLNPVAVLINKALIEIPPKFANMPPVNPIDRNQIGAEWKGAAGLAADVRYYGKWMRDEAEKRIGHLYPKVTLPKEYGGGEATVIAWLWARTVTCPNPACRGQAPLIRSLALSTRPKSKVSAFPIVNRQSRMIHFDIRSGEPSVSGTITRKGGRCLICDQMITLDHIRSEGQDGQMGMRLIATVCEMKGRRIYVPASMEQEAKGINAPSSWNPEGQLNYHPRHLTPPLYGFDTYSKLFTYRQLAAMTTLHDLLRAVKEVIISDWDRMSESSAYGDKSEYINALVTYLEFSIDKFSLYSCAFVRWYPKEDRPLMLFDRQAISMIWDFPEGNPFNDIGGSILKSFEIVADAIPSVVGATRGHAFQKDASKPNFQGEAVICTDPPYYDNVPYADLSDFFYVWQRHSLKDVYPELFGTLLVPKAEEIVADLHRHGGRASAEDHFLIGIRKSFSVARTIQSPSYPMTVYYAFKQAEKDAEDDSVPSEVSTTSTGWETMLEGLLESRFAITGTWPIRTERLGRMRDMSSNALASSIVLVCRPRHADARPATRREFLNALKAELPQALRRLQQGNIAPVDLAQAAIGPGMAVFSRYSKVIESDGSSMRVRTALQIINQELDAVLAEQEGEFDGDTRWAIAWFDQYGVNEGPYGVAETLSKAKNTSVEGMVEAGIVVARSGKVRLLSRDELPADWDPGHDRRVTVWEVAQHLVHALDKRGEGGAAALLARLGGESEIAHDLAYRLYTTCERKGWAQEALAYNSLVVAWPEIRRLAAEAQRGGVVQGRMEI